MKKVKHYFLTEVLICHKQQIYKEDNGQCYDFKDVRGGRGEWSIWECWSDKSPSHTTTISDLLKCFLLEELKGNIMRIIRDLRQGNSFVSFLFTIIT